MRSFQLKVSLPLVVSISLFHSVIERNDLYDERVAYSTLGRFKRKKREDTSVLKEKKVEV